MYGMTGREREEEDVPEVSFKYQLPLPWIVFLNSEWKGGGGSWNHDFIL